MLCCSQSMLTQFRRIAINWAIIFYLCSNFTLVRCNIMRCFWLSWFKGRQAGNLSNGINRTSTNLSKVSNSSAFFHMFSTFSWLTWDICASSTSTLNCLLVWTEYEALDPGKLLSSSCSFALCALSVLTCHCPLFICIQFMWVTWRCLYPVIISYSDNSLYKFCFLLLDYTVQYFMGPWPLMTFKISFPFQKVVPISGIALRRVT